MRINGKFVGNVVSADLLETVKGFSHIYVTEKGTLIIIESDDVKAYEKILFVGKWARA